MKPLTVNELYRKLGAAIAQGLGNAAVQVSSDDEQNDSHLVWDGVYLSDTVEFFNQKTKKMETSKSVIIC